MNQDILQELFAKIIEAIGEDKNREGLIDTPRRVAKMYGEIFSGLKEDPRLCLSKNFTAETDDLVIVKDIEFYSMCEHHFMPFYGKVHIAYLPNERKITGLSKLARLVDCLAKRPQIQENFTNRIATTIQECLCPKGIIVVIQAKHLCMSMRGIKNSTAETITVSKKGIYANNEELEKSVLALMGF